MLVLSRSRRIPAGHPVWMGAPVLRVRHWPESSWSGSSGLHFMPRKFETCPSWGAKRVWPALRYPSCMICLRPSSSAAISSVVATPSRLRRRSFATARIWSLTATVGCPSQEMGIRIGGLAFGELDSGTTITVLRLSFSTPTEITTQGRVLNLRTERRTQRYPPDITALRDHFHGSAISSPISSNSFSISATSRS